MSAIVWIDGVLHEHDEARVSAFDHGLLTGDGAFETLVVYAGRPFAIRRHLERLVRSCKGMGLPEPDVHGLRRAMLEVVEANGVDRGRLRVTITGGEAPLGSARGPSGPVAIVATGPATAWPDTADVVVVPFTRNEHGALAGLKTTSYGENVVALAYARQRGASEAIFANTAGRLCEGSGSNVFVVHDGRLSTPPLQSGCLAGVTRALVLEVTDAHEDDLPITSLGEADEAFLTSSTREVHPIARVDGAPLPAAPGPVTKAAAEAFRALAERSIDP